MSAPPSRHEALALKTGEEDLQRIWGAVGRARRRRRTIRRTSIAVTVGGALALAALWAFRVPGPEVDGGLATAEGAHPVHFDAAGRTQFADGSWIETGPDTDLSLLENNTQGISFHLRRGAIEVEVRPGGPRRWSIETGVATVQVVGTHFHVVRYEDNVRVRVDRGAVVVRSDFIDDGVRRVERGEEVEIQSHPSLAASSASVPMGPEPHLPQAPPDEARAEDTPAPARVRPSNDPSPRNSDPNELLRRSDEALLRGRPREAARYLERLLERHPRHPSAALADLRLARLEVHHLGRPQQAARRLERRLRGRPAPPLAASALALLSDAQRASGQPAPARTSACRYVERYPQGPRQADMERHCSGR